MDRATLRRRAMALVRKHGVVLESARGPVPSVAAMIAGGPVEGSWWSHPRANDIYLVTRMLRDSSSILVCRLVEGKVTFVHRRLWPALVCLAGRIGKKHLAAVEEEHTPRGHHELKVIPYPRWLPAEVRKAGKSLSIREAEEELDRALGTDWRSVLPRIR